MNLPHVFAKGTVSLLLAGVPIPVPGGSHWLADDPLVLAHPDAFTEDCRYGLAWSGEPPGVLSIPPGQEDPEMTAKVRERSQAEQAMTRGTRRGATR